MSKRQKQTDDDGATGSANKRARNSPGNASTTENLSSTSCGLKNTLHGNVFQLKLLMLFLIRGIGSGFQFRLGTEIPGMGGKFDDLIFKFKKIRNIGEGTSTDEQTESYRFLQAKHKQNEETEITAADLLNDNDGDFSLPKYFRSYFSDVINGTKGCPAENVHDCIICTNIGFEREEELRKNGIELIRLEDHDKILSFDKISDNKISARFRLRKTDKLRQRMAGWSDVHLLAKTLLKYVAHNKQLTISSPIFKSYHLALIHENVIDRERGKLCATFLEGDSRFREILSELTFVHYWTKLSFKSENKKGNRVGGSKKLADFEGISIEKRLPKCSQKIFYFCIFEDYYKDLLTQKIIGPEWRTQKPFTKEFIQGINLTQEGFEFRKKLCDTVFIHYWKDLTIQLSGTFGRNDSSKSENKSLNEFIGDEEINNFLDKLVFAVNTPNEVELDSILKSEVGKYYELHENDFQSDFILRNMLDWFKEKESKFMTSEEGKNIFKEGKRKMKSLRVTAISIDYQKQLKEVLEFNEEAIEKMKENLKQLLTSPNRIGRIATQLPKRTAVKVIAALEKLKLEETIIHNAAKLKEYYQRKDSYLVTSSSRLQKDRSKFKKTLKSEHSHNLLVVVCEDGASTENEESYQKLVKKILNKRLIIISQGATEIKDKLNFGDLSEKFKMALLEKKIEFQDSLKSVGDLIKKSDMTLDDLIENGCAKEVLDSNSIEELLIETDNISIRSCSSARFNPHLYIERKLKFPWDNSFYDQLAESMKCTNEELQKELLIYSQGKIEWFAEDHRKNIIWMKMKNIVKENRRSSRDSESFNCDVISEENLINKENRKGRVIIISGLAGTGKSTILSNYYERIKNENPDTWIIRIDLVDYRKDLAEFNFSRVDQSSAITFFVNIFAKNSPFARSLLTHRLQTDGRIVITLDGFDEIDSKLHEKVFQLISAIKSTKFDALYITTRSHLIEKLENKVFQFAYTLKNFSQEDQVNYLSNYWERKLEMPSVADGSIQLISKSLVNRLSTSLNDREKEFIGIPLQCRMLAECFETQLKDTIQQALPIDSLIENILKIDFDLTSLFSLIMKKKLEIYREEKCKADPHNHQANWIIENTMKNLEMYLRKLAIKTIVFYPKYVNVLLDQSSFQSKEEISQEEEDYTGGGVCFGFLDKGDKGDVKFLHQTYAEYLFAKYLHGGFLPEKDKNCNKLLTSETIRKIIFRKILVDEQYGGVRVFLNSMLKECVQPMAQLYREIEKSCVLGVAICDQNAKIFKFMCDCLDTSVPKVNIRRILSSNAFDSICYEPMFYDTLSYSMYKQNSKVFERFISYYDEDTDQKDVHRILNEMLYQPLYHLKELEPNGKKIMELVIRFLSRSRETKREISSQNFREKNCYILKVFICDEYYGSLLRIFVELLSSAYSEDSSFEYLLADTFECYRSFVSHENLTKLLTILRDLGRNEVLKGISRKILKMDIQLFHHFYQPKEEESTAEDVLQPTNIQSLLVRDSHGMTLLHRAALYDDKETVNKILETVRINNLSTDQESKNRGKKVLCNVIACDEEGITPLYVAAACEGETICQQMLIFLKEILPDDELRKYLTEKNGFLYNALWDAIKWGKVNMFRIVLKSAKKILGQDYLIALMKAQIPGKQKSCSCCNMFSVCNNRVFFEIVVEVIVDNERNSYEHLYELLFQNKKLTVYDQLQHIEQKIFQKMTTKELDALMKRLFDKDLRKGFDLMAGNLLRKLTAEQRSNLFCMITSINSGEKSYWDRWIYLEIFDDANYWNEYASLKKILGCISDILGQSAIQEQLVRNNYVVIINALLYQGKNLVDVMLTFISNNIKDEIIQCLVNVAPQMVLDEVVVNCDQRKESIDRFWIPNLLNFIFDYVENCDLSNLVNLICNYYIYNDSVQRERSVWIDYLYINRKYNEDVPAKIDKFLKCVLDKLGQNAVEKLVVEHEDNQIITLILTRTDDGKLVKALLRHLSREKREEIELKLVRDATAKMKNFIDNPYDTDCYWMNILHLQFVIKYADSVVLQDLVESITQSFQDGKSESSVWSNYIFNGDYDQDLKAENVDKFLQCVSEKLSKSKVKELVLHQSHWSGVLNSVIGHAASFREDNLVEAMLAHLTEEDRDEVRRFHVDTAVEFDGESLTSDCSSDGRD